MAKPSANSRRNVAAPPRASTAGPTILGFLDRIEEASLAGWAVDPGDMSRPLSLRVMIDGQIADVITCDLDRPDLHQLHLPNTRVGFHFAIPYLYQDGLRHVLSLATMDGQKVTLPARAGFALPELHFCLTRRVHVEGVLDGLVDGVVQGWALRVDERAGLKSGGLRILVSTGGQPLAELLADQFRADVAEALGADPCCGFTWTPPASLHANGAKTFDFHMMPDRVPLRGSPVELRMPGTSERARINALIEKADDLLRYAYGLRRDLRAVLPAETFSRARYREWAAQSQPLVPARIAARYGAREDSPLVSVICPVYRPEQGAFIAAVDSILAQTYGNWELILVDDGSDDARLTALLRRLAGDCERIRVETLPENRGIAAATNRAIELARGAFIAFFDHDDLLAACALDAMMRAQAATGARLLYSDEDKIDRRGQVSEPNFKPDFNYRLLLDLNYICHLVVVDAALAREAGPLDPSLDGAQDHDLLLRMIERLGGHEIHHVPEILYHWRITERSTAGAAAAKPAAADAGARAVAAHLRRRGIVGKTARRGGLTCYRTSFAIDDDPGVSILIPYRDHIAMTQQCVDVIREVTVDVSCETLLLDNWSQEADAERFAVEQGNLADTRVLRIPEPFNYSRINNLGVAAARHPFLLFMNNDVFVRDPLWLRTMLNEALADPGVGAVGAKLLYPNGMVQHAGVVLGVGGVADHGFRGLPGDQPGYIAHAIASREVAAVTAACMLVRREAFEAAGGFDEADLTVAFNDVDLCMKIRAAGYRIIYAADVVCEHRESLSRGDDFDDSKVARFMFENEAMLARWGRELAVDPFYSPHFSREGGAYRDLRVIDPATVERVAPQPPERFPRAVPTAAGTQAGRKRRRGAGRG